MLKKAILIGNGMTSQLIDEYKDCNMIEKIKTEIGSLYSEINDMLNPYRNLKVKDEKNITRLLEEYGMEYHHYQRYFVDQNLLQELEKPYITAIETLLKVAHLFNHCKKFDYEKIKKIANKIYFNKGKNGLQDTNKQDFNKEKFIDFINEFDFVFTTNFDNVLDDSYQGEVYHLHGGFHYEKINNIVTKSHKYLNPEEAYLIWGTNPDEKKKQMNIGGGKRYPYRYSYTYGRSLLNTYLDKIENEEICELHIWGYSGLNDGHINKAITNNTSLNNIHCYVSPTEIESSEIKNKMNDLYNSNQKHKLYLKSWDNIWSLFK